MEYDSFDAILHYIFRSVCLSLSSSSPCSLSSTDPRRCVVQALRRERVCRCLHPCRTLRLSSISLREPLPGTLRSRRTRAQPPHRNQSAQRCSPLSSRNCVRLKRSLTAVHSLIVPIPTTVPKIQRRSTSTPIPESKSSIP